MSKKKYPKIKKKIDDLILLKDENNVKIANHLEVSPPMISNRNNYASWNLHDMINLCDFLDCELQIVNKTNSKILTKFKKSDIE